MGKDRNGYFTIYLPLLVFCCLFIFWQLKLQRKPFIFQLFKKKNIETTQPRCWLSVKVFGNEVSVFSCEDIYSEINQLSLSMAELAVKLLKVSA